MSDVTYLIVEGQTLLNESLKKFNFTSWIDAILYNRSPIFTQQRKETRLMFRGFSGEQYSISFQLKSNPSIGNLLSESCNIQYRHKGDIPKLLVSALDFTFVNVWHENKRIYNDDKYEWFSVSPYMNSESGEYTFKNVYGGNVPLREKKLWIVIKEVE